MPPIDRSPGQRRDTAMMRPLQPGTVGMGALLTALVGFGAVSTDLYLPSLPAIVAEFGTTISEAQLTLSIFMAGFAVAQLVYGPLSDRFGRRPVLLGGLVLYALASLACAFADSIATLQIGRFVQAIGACCGPVLSRAVVRDLYSREDAARVLAFMGAAMGLIPAAAPVLGGQVEVVFGWRGNFVVLMTVGLVVLAATAVFLAETNQSRDPAAIQPLRMLRNYIELFGHRTYVGFMLSVAFAFGGLFSFISGAAFVFIGVYGVAPDAFGFYFSGGVIGFITGSLVTARFGKRLGLERMLRCGAVIAALGALVILALALFGPRDGHLPALLMVGGMIIFLAGFGLVMPNGYAGAVAPFPRKAGAAAALVGCLQMATAAIFGGLVGLFHDGTPLPMAIMIGISTTGAILAAFVLIPHPRVNPSP